MLKAPYNFVPLSDKLYIPEWGTQVNHCIPFSNGITGTINLAITAETPIFVRNGHTKEENENRTNGYKSFSKDQNNYFIPGTSIKGAIRNVMEIMSFGKLTQFENDSFAFRDLSPFGDGKYYTNMMRNNPPHCGWLKLSTEKLDSYILEDCDIPELIETQNIDSFLGTNNTFSRFIHNINVANDEEKNARKKYEMLFQLLQKKYPKYAHDEFLSSNIYLEQKINKKILVFTGQPGKRKDYEKKGKHKEFLFGPVIEKLSVSDEDIQSFFSIHKNSDDFSKFWQIKLKQGDKIPVFFQRINGRIFIGLSYMYKYPCEHTVSDAIYQTLQNPKDVKSKTPLLDLSEIIFGHIYHKSLKGRVQVGHAFARMTSNMEMPEQAISLSSPHSSYYPLYIGDGKSWNSKGKVVIAGRKRYPTRHESDMFTNTSTANTSSYIRALRKGTIFDGAIHFHNLRPIELGALLSAITFHNQADCYHNLGAGKPLGYGKVKITVNLEGTDVDGNKVSNLKQYLDIFKTTMDQWLKSDWLNAPSNVELFGMARGIPQGKGNQFQYMKMTIGAGNNNSEFKNGKDEYAKGKRLGKFTEIITNKISQVISDVQCSNEMTEYEQKKKWIIDINKEYRAFINANNQVCICHPERKNELNIFCTYEYDNSSKIHAEVGSMVKLKVVRKEKKSVKINITKILGKK